MVGSFFLAKIRGEVPLLTTQKAGKVRLLTTQALLKRWRTISKVIAKIASSLFKHCCKSTLVVPAKLAVATRAGRGLARTLFLWRAASPQGWRLADA